jgi:multiple sugar transport system ATP-binding protein
MFPLTVGKNKIAKTEAQKIAEEYMKLTNIEELSNKKPGTLSGGQQQRVAITRALVQKPDILLLDEPLSNLDARLRLRIREEIRRLVKEVGITAIFVTHDQEEALSISDKIILMNEGVVQQFALPQELYLEPANLFVANFIGSPIINTMKISIADGQMDFGDFQVPLSVIKDARRKAEITDGSYTFAIRSEDVRPELSGGVVDMETDDNEVIGRDCILRFEKNGLVIKSVVSLDQAVRNVTRSLTFNFNKAFIFDEAGERVY